MTKVAKLKYNKVKGRITTLKAIPYKGCMVYLRRIDISIFEYLVVVRKQIFSAYWIIKPSKCKQNITSAGTHTTGQMVRTTFTTKILAANLEAHDTIGLKLYRDVDGGGDSGDTLATNARLLNTHFHFIQNKLGEAT